MHSNIIKNAILNYKWCYFRLNEKDGSIAYL